MVTMFLLVTKYDVEARDPRRGYLASAYAALRTAKSKIAFLPRFFEALDVTLKYVDQYISGPANSNLDIEQEYANALEQVDNVQGTANAVAHEVS